MSRQVINDHPWTADEIQYQLERGREKDIEQNKRDFPPVSVDNSPTLQLDRDIFETVNTMGLDQLRLEHDKRNLVPAGDEKALKLSLAQLLQSERDHGDSQA